ncbi:MAG: segregation/condensation protein A [Oscillospiraceae bacterium]|nr:segregation/condensation protein A [Oscillospiraceae bacterium]
MTQEPSYHLEGVIRSKDEMEDFTGPLDLILLLLSRDKIEIRDIQISVLLDQYLDYLRMMKEMDLDIASEFVQMASHLAYIKTKMLLTEEKEPTEMELLVSALEQLKARDTMTALRSVAPELGERIEQGARFQTRGPLPLPSRPYDYHHEPRELIAALAQILLRGTGEVAPEDDGLRRAAPKPIIYHVRDKSREIRSLLRERGHISLQELFTRCRSRSELVAAFLSVLELCSAGDVRVSGERGSYEVYETEQEQEQSE